MSAAGPETCPEEDSEAAGTGSGAIRLLVSSTGPLVSSLGLLASGSAMLLSGVLPSPRGSSSCLPWL